MCGIAGILGVPPERAEPALGRMLRALAHRGPDDTGSVCLRPAQGDAPPLWLGHTRLAILDLTAAGHQPMADGPAADPESAWITFNGEVYNFHELADELAGQG